MKKTYKTPETQVFKVQPSQIIMLSANNTTLSSEDFGENGNYEICTKEENRWGAGW